MSTSKNSHGGTRKGAGRPPLGDKPKVATSVYLDADVMAYLKKLGKGSVSEGIMKLYRIINSTPE